MYIFKSGRSMVMDELTFAICTGRIPPIARRPVYTGTARTRQLNIFV